MRWLSDRGDGVRARRRGVALREIGGGAGLIFSSVIGDLAERVVIAQRGIVVRALERTGLAPGSRSPGRT